MLASGAQAQEVETRLLAVMQALGLAEGEAIVTNSSVTVSYVAPGDAEATTAIRAIRQWVPDFARLEAAAALAADLRAGRSGIATAESELDRIAAMAPPYGRWLRFAAPALLSAAVTIMFGGSALDALATLAIGLIIQPALEAIERSALPLFFQVVFGVAATTLLIVALMGLGLPIDGSLVLTGGLLRFLPGAQLVAGMRDLIAGAIVPGAANLAQVILLGVAVAGTASLILAFGEAVLGVALAISVEGLAGWPAPVTVLAGAAAVAAYAVRLGVPRRALLSGALLGGLAVVIARGLAPGIEDLEGSGRTLLAALLIGVIGRLLAERADKPAALWIVPAILPLLPAPATLLPLLAETEAAQQALQGQALTTAFVIGVGVASGDILVSTYLRYRPRVGSH
jgi:uncharacterized membrane protein YjjP (DUF1212 family)/uncharacterized membrane protein YjjB (DUF3815 family)